MLSALVTVSILTLGQAGPDDDKTMVVHGRPPIGQALFNPDGRRIYFVTHASIEGHDIETGKRLFNAPHAGHIVSSPKGDLLAVVHINIGMTFIGGSVAVRDASTGKLLHTVTGTSARFSPDSRWLITHSNYTWGRPATDEPPKLQITDLRTGKTHLAQLPGGKGAGPGFRNDTAGGHLQFTKDGKALVTRTPGAAGQYSSGAACDLATGKILDTLPKDEELVLARDLRYSADGKRFVDKWSVFDVEAGKPIAKLEPHKHAKSDSWYPWFQLSADGKSVFSATTSQREVAVDEKNGRTTLTMASHLHVWDADSGKWKQIIVDAKRVATVAIATNKKLGRFDESEPKFLVNPQGTLAVDYDETAVTVWDLKTGKTLRTLRDTGHPAQHEILHFSPDGKWIAAASTSGYVSLCNAQSGQPGQELDRAAHLGDVCFRPKSDELIGAGHGLIYVWDLKSGQLKRTFEQKGNLFRIACHPDGKTAAISDHWSDSVTLIEIDTGKEKHRLTGKGKSLAFNPDGSALLSLDPYGNVGLWDAASGKRLKYWPSGKSADYRYAVHRAAFLPGATRYLLCENNTAAVIDAATGKRVLEHSIKNEAGNQPTDADVHPGGKRFVVAYGRKQDIEERDIETGKVLRTYPGYHYGTSQARYSPDGSLLVTAGTYAYELRIHRCKVD